MLEGLVAGLLNRFLGMYVKNFDPTQLKVGIWSGDVKLKNLELRREALDQLKLPINVVEGHLGQLTLVIPWSNLRGAPVKVFVEDVFLLASPKEEAEYDPDEEDRRKQRIKMEKLESAELLKDRNQEGLSQEEQKKSSSFTSSLVTKIVDNVQITVKNIHVRYEDSISAPGHPFALGVTLEEFSAVSTDGQWKPTFITTSSSSTQKLAKLGALAVYWNTDTDLLGSGRESHVESEKQMPHDEMVDKFKSMIGSDASAMNTHQYILRPVSGQAKIEIDKSGDVKVPKLKAKLLFEEIGLVLDDDQYRDALMMVDLFHYFIRHQEYKRLQPKDVSPKEDPRAWLRFAGHAVLSKIHERNRKWSWDYFRERRDDRVRYIELFKKKKQQQQLTSIESEDLTNLENKLEYEDLRFWRSLSRNQLKKENAAAVKNQPQQEQAQGWIGWIWGSKPETKIEHNEENTQMTEDQRKELYDAIDWDEKTALAEDIDLPREAVKLCVEASLGTGSFTLKKNPNDNPIDLLSLHFDVFKAKALQRKDSLLANVSLGGLRVNDGTTPDSLYPEIVRVKDAPDSHRRKRISLAELEEAQENPFFEFEFERNPIEREGDIAVVGKLMPLEVVWNPKFLVGLVGFFRPPERHMESIAALMETAGATVEGLREQTRAGLEFALEEHKTINAQLDLQAPLIIVPVSITSKDSNCLIVDAGHIHVNSELVDQNTMKEIQSKQRQSYSDEDLKRLESVMYDKFIVKLTSTQILIGPSISKTKAQLDKKDSALSPYHVVEQINVDFVVETSILPKATNLTKLKVSGHLPMLHATVSDSKYKNLMKVIDTAIPKFSDEIGQAKVKRVDSDQSTRPPLLSEQSEKSQSSRTTSRGRRKSIKEQRRQSAALNFLQPSTAVILEDADDDNDNFEDANDGAEDEHLRANQRSFQFTFKVDKLKGSLYRSDPDGEKPDALLVELVAERFDLLFYTRPYDMSAEVSLGSVTVDDFVDNPPAEFKSIISSGDNDDLQAGRSLVHVKFIRVNRQSPDFMSVYEGVEMNLTAVVSTINVVVTRKTLLTLLDFVLITFASGEKSESQAIEERDGGDSHVDEQVDGVKNTNSGAIKVKVDLKSIRLILNNDGIRLATLSFNHADAGIFLRGKTMRIAAKLGDLSLVDDVNTGVPESSNLRKLVTIQGDELADFRYETFDATNTKVYPGYDSSVFLRAGSVKVNFMEEPFRKVIDFLIKFGKMQALYNAARQAAANQANQMQQSPAKFKFDIVVKTPIVVFPRIVVADHAKRDLITAYLGEIYAQNKFAPLNDSEDTQVAMKISAGIRNIRLTSEFHYSDERAEELEMIDHVDLGFNIVYAEHIPGLKRPDTEIKGSMSDLKLRLTQYQLQSLMEISKSVPAALAGEGGDEDEAAARAVDQDTLQRARTIQSESEASRKAFGADLKPELDPVESEWTKLDLLFSISTIGLELIMAPEDEPVGDLGASSLSRFSLDDTKVKTRILSDSSLEAELLIRSFTILDSRPREINKFRRIMTSSNKDVQQLMASVTMSGGKDRGLIAMAAIDSPRIIFALDYLFDIQRFISEGLRVDTSSPMDDESIADTLDEPETGSLALTQSHASLSRTSRSPPDHLQTDSEQASDEKVESNMSMAIRINLVDAQVILIANPLSSSSEAIVLKIRQMVLSRQHALTFQISEVGMYLCRMDRFEWSRLRIIDDFSVQLSADSSKPLETDFQLDVEPLVLRLSLRDILLVTQIVGKAGELSSNSPKPPTETAVDKKARKLRNAGLAQKSASGRGQSTMAGRTHVSKKSQAIQPPRKPSGPQSREELSAKIEGVRIVLIGDLHELPILDIGVKPFTATANNWSSNLKAGAAIDLYTNVYNFSKSSWEPLVEPWQVGMGVARDPASGLLSIDVTSKKTFDVTITTATIALASKSFDFLTTGENILDKPRGGDAPYRIRNNTGFGVVVSAKSPSSEENLKITLDDGNEAPWSFEDREKMRENLLSETLQNDVGILLEGSGFDQVKNVRLNREGEFLYSLKPKADDVLHRLCVEVSLGTDNVKYVTLRSPLVVENATEIPVELGVYDARDGHLLKIEKINPGDARSPPVGAVYEKRALIRPDAGFGYRWSSDQLWWKDLLKRRTRQIVCKGDNGDPFYFQVHARFDKSSPVTNSYPFMRIKLSAPVTLENLLPYDFNYRIEDRNTPKMWNNFLRKGGVSPVHVVELSHLLLLSVDMQDTVFKPSEPAIINSGAKEDLPKDKGLVCKDEQGLTLHLGLHYYKVPDSGGAFKITVYSPYVILNKTGLDLTVRAKAFLQQARAAAGQFSLRNASSADRSKALPFMFSYSTGSNSNRALVKVADSEWSKPQSFDAVGSASEFVLNSTSKNREIHIGITVQSGNGKYKLTKVVTLAPRFVLKNKIGSEILIRESSSPGYMTLQSGALQPLHFMQRSAVKQLCLCHPGVDNKWTAPFNIAEIGTTYVKILKAGGRWKLIKVEILMEDATIFLHFSYEEKNWPFSMRNESDHEFTFYQANPNIDEDGVEDRSGWKPINYRLPPRSIMPYSWDFPAAKYREIILICNRKERHIKLAEIGNQIPMKFVNQQGQQHIVDINVAADGPTQTLILSNFRASQSMFKPKNLERTKSGFEAFEIKDQDTGATFRATLKLSGVGISLVNAQLKELAYVTFKDVQLTFTDSPVIQTVSLTVKWMQIDNQLYGGLFPMILYPSVVPAKAQEVESHPSLHAMVGRVKDDSYGVLYIKYASILLQQMTVDLDEDFIFALLDFTNVRGASWTIEADGKLCDEEMDIPEPTREESGQNIYFEVLDIQPMQIDLSFMRTQRINAEDQSPSRNPLMFFVNVMTMTLGNINDAPIRFNALKLDNVRVTTAILVQNITSHYRQEIMYQIHKILGSADFLGNPVGLFNNISSGVTDIFYEPYQGLILSDKPEEFGLGIARGAASFAKKTVYGFSDSFSKFTGSLSKGLATASMDKQFQDRRRITRARNRPKHALYGVTAGANSLFTGVASGVGGAFTKPLEGAEKEGALGFFKGVGKGFLGLATKPAVGVLDMASNISEGIRNTTTVFDGSELDRSRYPRFVPNDGIVRPFNPREALGQYWLKQVDNGRYFNEQYIGHLELPKEDMVVMVTFARLLLIRSRKLTSEWDVPLKDVQTIAKERTGVTMTLRGGANGPFIPVGGGSERSFLYKMLGVAVEEFNRRFRGTE